MAKKTKKGAAYLSKADIVIASSDGFAAAFEYSENETPVTLKKAARPDFERFILESEKLGVPVIEHSLFSKDLFAKLKEEKPIPKDFYLTAAQALAFIYKTTQNLRQIKYVRSFVKDDCLSKELKKLTDDMLSSLAIDTVRVEVGRELFNRKNILDGSFLNLRQKIALDLGLALPNFKINLNSSLDPWKYNIFIKETSSVSGEVEKGVTGDENVLIIKNKLGQFLYSNAHRLLSYMDVYNLILNLEKTGRPLVNELFPRYLSIPALRLILKNLLREEVSIRGLENILEVILENLPTTSNPNILTEYIRIENRASITEKLKDNQGNINVLILDPSIEKLIFEKIDEKNNALTISPDEALSVLKALDEKLKQMASLGIKAAILTSPYLRRFIRKIVENTFPHIPVVSYSEIMPMSKVQTMGVVKI